MMRSETELVLTLLAYALAAGSSLLIGYLAWRKSRSPRRHYYPHQRGQQRKDVWGWEYNSRDWLNLSAEARLKHSAAPTRSGVRYPLRPLNGCPGQL